MDEPSIFTKIINGDLPCHKVYEDEYTFAFLDIFPVQPGMVVVVTKIPTANIEDLSDNDYQALWAAVKKVAKRMRRAFPDKKKIAMQVEGLEVPHVHVKMFPINTADEFRSVADTSKEPDHEALELIAEKLRLA